MGRSIAITNQKGGVGKTTTAVNLSACLAAAEKKTLIIDMDPQGNASSGFGYTLDRDEDSIYSVLIGEKDLPDIVRSTEIPYLDIAPAHPDLAGAEVELIQMVSKEQRLKNAQAMVKSKYEYIIVDSPPSLGVLTLNTLTAADTVIIPIQCEYYALEGLGRLLGTIRMIQKYLNQDLAIEGVLLTMYDRRVNLSRQVADETRSYFGDKVYKTYIPRNVKLGEAPSFGKPILLYDVMSTGAQSYLALAEELMRNEQESAWQRIGSPDSDQ